MAVSRRGILAGAAAGLFLGGVSIQAADEAPAAAAVKPLKGAVNEAQLGELIQALGITPEKQQQRYDFAFVTTLDEQKWEFSMSAVLSQDTQSIWLMAWLDPCPTSAADVPRTALLRLLAENDKMGNGKFFAYIPSNRRFVLQRTVVNEDMTSAKFKNILQDLGTTVVETHPTWSVAGWSASASPSGEGAAAAAPTASAAPAPKGPTAASATKAAANDPKFQTPVKK
jgi:hypothetical protein